MGDLTQLDPDALVLAEHNAAGARTGELVNRPGLEVRFAAVPDADHCTVESLVEVALGRLRHLQNKLPCEYNAQALESLERALRCLEARTQDRAHRGVLGTDKQ